MLDLRRARGEDDLRPLWMSAFEPEEAFFLRDYRPERALIWTDREKPVSMLHILPRVVAAGGERLSAGYIMGVATDPAYRRRGLAGELIKAALRRIEELNCACAMLIPASGSLSSYYGRFGFALRGARPRLSGVPADGVRAGIADIPKLSALYDGMFPHRAERNAFEWETILLIYTVRLTDDGYTVWDGDTPCERVPVSANTDDDERAACIYPYGGRAETLLSEYKPYINLLYT